MGYRGKLAEREEARRLRAQGLTMPEIAEQLGVSRSSVSLWTRDVPFVPRPRRVGERRARRRAPNVLQRRKQAEINELLAEGRRRIGRMTEQEFLVAGAMLYAGEGSKGDGMVCLANTDARFIAFFCRWLRHFFDIDESRLRVRLYLHEELDLGAAIAHWSTVTGIPPGQFGKPYRAVADPSIRRTKHEHGCVGVAYGCSRTHRAIMGLVHGLFDDSASGHLRLHPAASCGL